MMTDAVWKTRFMPSRTEPDLLELGAAVVDGGPVDRAQDAIGHVIGTGNLEKWRPAR